MKNRSVRHSNMSKSNTPAYLTLSLFVLMIVFIVISCNTQKKDANPTLKLAKPEVFNDEYPRAFFFRASEKVYEPYIDWDNNYNRLSGIMGKVLHEEVKNREMALEYFKRFKKEHPEQVVLLHFNGNARDPRYKAESFFAGHWLYFEGSKILSNLSSDEDISEIKVSNARLFKMKTGNKLKYPDEIGICSLDENGNTDWNNSEQVELLGVDYEKNTIKVKRGCFGTLPKKFQAGKAYAAAHVMEGPWGKQTKSNGEIADNPMLWYYNYSTLAPKDKNGNQCFDILAEDVGKRFLPGGELESFDGVEFDVLHHDLKHHSYAYLDKDRAPDCNADTKPDAGIINGINTYGTGTFLFCKKLRKVMGDKKLILADGYSQKHVRAFSYLNGMESEGWPNGSDTLTEDWSGGINRFMFWDQNAQKPVFNFVNHRWWTKEPPANVNRMVLAATVFTNSVYSVSGSKPFAHNEVTPADEMDSKNVILYDEIVKGQANQKQWLGKPLGPMVRLAEQFSHEISDFELDGNDIVVRHENDRFLIQSKNHKQDDLSFTIKNIDCPGNDLLVLLDAKGEALKDYPKEMGRLVRVSIPDEYVEGKFKHDFMSWMNEKSFESEFYFSTIRPGKIELQINIEGNEPVDIQSLKLFAAPHIVYREFEHGLVIANLSHLPFQMDLSGIFPNKEFVRIRATQGQDNHVNNGEKTGNLLVIPPRDALFLSKIQD